MIGRANRWVLGCLALLWQPALAQTVVEYIHTDALGSVVAVTDQNRNVLERREYEPYGSQLAPAVQDGPGYAGHVQDATTGLSYMQQRYYDPEGGRFLSVDPVTVYSNGDMRFFNRYAYAFNNPYKFTDPDGRETGAAFRSVNNATNGGPVNRPPRSRDDWLGPAIGVALTGVVAAPAVGFSGPGLSMAAADIAMGDALGGASLAAGATGVKVTADMISDALAGSEMQTAQRAISLPVVQRYVDALLGGSEAPAIKAHGKIIVDGNHRYAAGRIVGQEPTIQPGALAPSQADQIRPVQDMGIDPKDWDN